MTSDSLHATDQRRLCMANAYCIGFGGIGVRELVVHIGLHKTGSGSIQHALNGAHSSLREQGVYVPVTSTMGHTKAHHNIAWELNDDRRFRPQRGTLKDLHAELSSVSEPIVVLSSEGFSKYRPGKKDMRAKSARLRQLAESLSRRLVIVAFVRDYASALNSAYTQQVKTFGHAMSFAEYLVREELSSRWLYGNVLAEWEAVANRMVVRPFGGDVVVTFFGMLGIVPQADGYERVNEGFGPRAIEACRVLYRHYSLASPKGLRKGGPTRLIRQVADGRGWNATPFWGFLPEQAVAAHLALEKRDAAFLGRHEIEFAQRFRTREYNEQTLEQMEGDARREFMEGLAEIVVTSKVTFDEDEVEE